MHPILLKLGPLTIYSYGFMLAVALIVAIFLAKRKAARCGINPERIIDLAILMMFLGIAGARITYVLLNLGDFVKRPVEIFYLHKGGLVFYGGAVSAGLVGIFYAKKNNMPILNTADLLAPYIALGQSIGRIGCLLNGCCFGKPADLPWAISLPQQSVLLHPTQAYESLATLSIFLILAHSQDKKRFHGRIFVLYLLLYSSVRFCIEFLRGDNAALFLKLTFSQIVSILIFIIALFCYIKMSKDEKLQV